MSKRDLVLHVEVIETDDAGKTISTHCSHSEHYSEDFFPDSSHLEYLLHCAYEGFDFARNKFCGSNDNQA